MEGVGRLGRSSARYATTTVFTGPVRKWKKTWVHLPPSNSNHHQTSGTINGSNGSSHLLLFKWAPISISQNDSSINNNNDANADSNDLNKDDTIPAEEPPKKKFKYIPIIELEEQNNESSEENEDDAKLETDSNPVKPISNHRSDEKPDINDVPMEENQDPEHDLIERQDLNVSTLDLSLGFNGDDGDDGDDENESGSKADKDDQSE